MIPSREGGDQLCYSTILTFAQLPERNREFGRFDRWRADLAATFLMQTSAKGSQLPTAAPWSVSTTLIQPGVGV